MFRLLYNQSILIACTNNTDNALGIKDVKQLRISGENVDVDA